MNSIKVSVIMPVYNTGEYLKTAVESILSQSLKEFELILVDDGSTDGSSERCDEYACQDSRVVVLHQKNGGICNARNAALKIAKGDYIAFSDHDDEYLPGLLENAYKRALETKADVVKFCKKVLLTYDGKILRERSNKLKDDVLNADDIKDNYLSFFNKTKINCVWDSLFKRDVFYANNLFFDEFYKCGGEDFDITARYLPHISKIAMMSNVYYVHYIRKGVSTSFKYNPFKLKHIKRLTNVIIDNAIKIGVDIDKKKEEVNFFLTEFFINGFASVIENPACPYKLSEKVQMLKELKDEPCMQHSFNSSSSMKMRKESTKIALSYFFYKHSLFSALLLMHKVRNWQSNSKLVNKFRR